MREIPSRLRRLDDALADLPLEDPMLLSELDGFLTGTVLCPETVPRGEWLTIVWGADDGGMPPFEDPLDVRWFADAVTAHHDEIVRDLARGKPQPILDIDKRNGDILWEVWVSGFAQAMDLRPERWSAWAASDPDAADALATLTLLIAIDRHESALDIVQIDAMQPRVPDLLIDAVRRLYAARRRIAAVAAISAVAASSPKVGRNDSCPCGSGRKFKRCCA